MNNLLTKISAAVGITAALSVAIAFGTNNPAQAVTFNYSFETDTGYVGTGEFSYDPTPASLIVESGIGPTNFLNSLSLSVFDPAGNLLASGNEVTNGVSNSSFLRFEFNPLTKTLSILDNSTDVAGGFSYFITNAFDLSYNPVTPGSTTFNLFSFETSTGTATFLGSTPSIQVASTPEPASVLGLLALGAMGVGSALKKKKA